MDIDKIILQLEHGRMPKSNWLQESYQNPELFWQEVFYSAGNQRSAAPTSEPFSYYDFYYDLVLRHIKSKTKGIAFQWYDGHWQKYSYYDLAVFSQIICQNWQNQGVQPGQKICIIMTPSVIYIAVLMASLKLGLVISYLPP